MANANDTTEVILQNLFDSGFDEQTAEICIEIIKKGNLSQILPMLETQRSQLLNSIHTQQKQIDCLDYLVFQIKQNKLEVLL